MNRNIHELVSSGAIGNKDVRYQCSCGDAWRYKISYESMSLKDADVEETKMRDSWRKHFDSSEVPPTNYVVIDAPVSEERPDPERVIKAFEEVKELIKKSGGTVWTWTSNESSSEELHSIVGHVVLPKKAEV